MPNEELIKILDREFAAAAPSIKGSVLKQAEYLGMTQIALSRYRSGARNLSESKARAIAEKFSQHAGNVKELTEELLKCVPRPAEAEGPVHLWFKERGRPGLMMLVEFREVPAISPDAAGNANRVKELTTAVAEAVAAGLSYGMFLPFNLSELKLEDLPGELMAYLLEIQNHVKTTYKTLQSEILEHVNDDVSIPEANLENRLKEAAGRLRLYVSCISPHAASGIGYRSFFVEEDGDPRGQQWEWVSLHGPDQKVTHQMVKKNPSPVGLRAAAGRFSPVPEFWRSNKRLPESDDELGAFSIKLGKKEITWKLFDFKNDLGESITSIVKRFLKDKQEEK
jgi:transcriptional regulator with XRE-family HTH domain